jgi:hypothetical protein
MSGTTDDLSVGTNEGSITGPDGTVIPPLPPDTDPDPDTDPRSLTPETPTVDSIPDEPDPPETGTSTPDD